MFASGNSKVIDNNTNLIGFIVTWIMVFSYSYCSEDLRYLNQTVGEKIEI